MFKGTLTNQQVELLLELVRRGSLFSLRDSVKGVRLDDFQTLSLAWSLIVEGAIVSLDTGLGKTLISAGYMNCIKQKYKRSKFIFICERSAMNSLKKKLQTHTDLKILSTTAEGEELDNALRRNNPLNYDVLMVTYEALHSYWLNSFLINNKEFFNRLIVDEAHKLGNNTSFINNVVYEIARHMKGTLMLTATPITTSPEQIINIMTIIDPTFVQNKKSYLRKFMITNEMGEFQRWQGLEQMQEDLALRYINFTRKELGIRGNYKPILELVEGTALQRHAEKLDMWRMIKGQEKSPQTDRLLQILKQQKQQDKRGIIYCNTNENKRMLLKVLLENGIRVNIIDGSLSNKNYRDQIQAEFNTGLYDVLITNITTALDLPCDFIIFWEFTVDFKQVIGRGERGLEGRDLEIIFIITKNTVEYDYFVENIFARAEMMRDAVGKDVSEIEEIMNQLDKKLNKE